MADLLLILGVFVASFAVSHSLISRVPTRLHTPLMSMTNAVSAVTILGALLLFASELGWTARSLGLLAVLGAAFNIVGGFAVTDRMLRMFRLREKPGR